MPLLFKFSGTGNKITLQLHSSCCPWKAVLDKVLLKCIRSDILNQLTQSQNTEQILDWSISLNDNLKQFLQ